MTGTSLHILIVEDNLADARFAREMLGEAPGAVYTVTHVERLADAVDSLAHGGVDAILLDLSLPDAHGLEAVARLHAIAPRVPIVVVSGADDPALAVAGVRVGAQDYLVKGQVDSAALVRALRYAMERQRVDDRLNHLAHHDTLTDLPNRALLYDRLRQALAHARRHDLPLAVLFIDLDGFKDVNDTRGHDTGDVLLQETARRLKSCTREGDTVARFGGDEFAVLLPDIKEDGDAAIVARRMLDVLALPFPTGACESRVTASIGIGVYPSQGGAGAEGDGGDGGDTIVKSADTAMYKAKEAGKN
ncbi:MAG: GGDEF domain-containing response regulator, partial [Chloroflexi bacterium]|nr:GGDEF domain-containing response regulator [Chloroflexota bacterium]